MPIFNEQWHRLGSAHAPGAAKPGKSARGLAQSKTLREIPRPSVNATASWSAVALHRFRLQPPLPNSPTRTFTSSPENWKSCIPSPATSQPAHFPALAEAAGSVRPVAGSIEPQARRCTDAAIKPLLKPPFRCFLSKALVLSRFLRFLASWRRYKTHFVAYKTRFVRNIALFVANIGRFVSYIAPFVSYIVFFVACIAPFVRHIASFISHITLFVAHKTHFVSHKRLFVSHQTDIVTAKTHRPAHDLHGCAASHGPDGCPLAAR